MGYRTDVVEFVSTEHTARNLMIRAVRGLPVGEPAFVREYLEMKQFWGVTPYIERALGEAFQEASRTASLRTSLKDCYLLRSGGTRLRTGLADRTDCTTTPLLRNISHPATGTGEACARRTTPASARRRSRRWRRASAPPRRALRATPPEPSAPGRRPAVPRRCRACTTPGSGSGRRGGRVAGRVRSVTVAGSKSVFGSPFAAPGRYLWNHARNSAGGSTRRIRSASQRLGEKKSAPSGSQRAGASASFAEVGLRPLLDQLAELLVADRSGVVVGERQAERGVRVDAGADRVRLLREVLDVARRDQLRERLEVRRPLLRVRVVPAVQFLGELQQPRPAVGPLERLRLACG